jgi:hypothetical protein
MTKLRVLESAAMGVTLFVMTLICVGCNDNKPAVVGGGGGVTRVHGRKCPPGPPQHHQIEIVVNSEVFKDPADKALVACETDMVSWFISNGSSGTIDVTFKDSFAQDLFGKVHFVSNPANPQSETDNGTVQSQDHHRGQVYKYTIIVKDSYGNQQGKLDPHVIPM